MWGMWGMLGDEWQGRRKQEEGRPQGGRERYIFGGVGTPWHTTPGFG
jgi:hypothetical protein